jgi:hypothetical protein
MRHRFVSRRRRQCTAVVATTLALALAVTGCSDTRAADPTLAQRRATMKALVADAMTTSGTTSWSKHDDAPFPSDCKLDDGHAGEFYNWDRDGGAPPDPKAAADAIARDWRKRGMRVTRRTGTTIQHTPNYQVVGYGAGVSTIVFEDASRVTTIAVISLCGATATSR